MHSFIETLPQGYDTPVGIKGVRLSGGQKQRLGLARIFLLDPPLFLLDEPTSALDSSSEADIQRALDLMMKGRTSITIAHRLSTVIRAHRLYVLEQGSIIAKGTHEELLTFCEPYQRFVKQQNLT
jgi:ABC-type multidrug transport system fused ATPase/permease subunit